MKGDKLFENLIIGSIKTANVVLTGMDMLGGAIIDSFSFLLASSKEENITYDINDKNNLEELWRKEFYYMTDDKINDLLKQQNLYYYSLKYDGRYKCIEALIKDLVLNNKKPY